MCKQLLFSTTASHLKESKKSMAFCFGILMLDRIVNFDKHRKDLYIDKNQSLVFAFLYEFSYQ